MAHGGLIAPPWPSGAARQSPLVSFPTSHPECQFIPRKICSLLLPTTPPSVSSRCSSSRFLSRTQLGAPGAPGCCNAAPFCSVPHPSASLSSQNHSRISFRPYLSISLRFTSSVCLSEAIGLTTGVLCAWVFGCCDAAPFGQFPIRAALSPRKSTLRSPSDRTSRSPLASLPRFAYRSQLGARGLITPGCSGAAT